MGPKCPTCSLPVGVKGMARRYREQRGRRCRRCGAVFRIYADEQTMAGTAGLVMLALIVGVVLISMADTVLSLSSGLMKLIVFACLGVVFIISAWLGAKTRRTLPPGDRCAQCGYDITHCTGDECPECGVSFFVRPPVPKDDAPQ